VGGGGGAGGALGAPPPPPPYCCPYPCPYCTLTPSLPIRRRESWTRRAGTSGRRGRCGARRRSGRRCFASLSRSNAPHARAHRPRPRPRPPRLRHARGSTAGGSWPAGAPEIATEPLSQTAPPRAARRRPRTARRARGAARRGVREASAAARRAPSPRLRARGASAVWGAADLHRKMRRLSLCADLSDDQGFPRQEGGARFPRHAYPRAGARCALRPAPPRARRDPRSLHGRRAPPASG
jgi:hypothetical protein